jgi:hypothetical protein
MPISGTSLIRRTEPSCSPVLHVLRSFIDNIYAEGCDGSYDGAGGLNGNGAVFTTQYCQVGKVITKDCGGGIKFQDESQDTDIAELKVHRQNQRLGK